MNLNRLPHGDMPGDIIKVKESFVPPVQNLFQAIKDKIKPKTVIAISGGSGSGKSTAASILAGLLLEDGKTAYILSGDNYPHRVPAINDAKRMEVYKNGGRQALEAYLGTEQEIDFARVNEIIADFKAGRPSIAMRRLGIDIHDRFEELVNMENTDILILEWTHANSPFVKGTDIRIFLESTPEVTLKRRVERGRNDNVKSPFIAMVLELEQGKLERQAGSVHYVLHENGEVESRNEP